MIRDAVFVARKHLAYLAFDKETLLWAFVMPPVFFYFIGTVTAGFSGGPSPLGGESLLAATAEDGGSLQDEILRRVADERFELVRAGDEGAGEPSEHARRLEFPARFTERALAGGDQAVVRFVRRGDGASAEYERVRLARAVYTVLADLLVLRQEGTAPSPEAFAELARRERALKLDVRPAGERRHVPTGFEQAVPGTMVMFTMSVLLSGGAVLLVVERRRGLLRRLAATPVSPGSLVLGKWAGNMALGALQLAFAMVVGSLFFGMDWGGPALPAVAGVLLLWAAFNAALALLLGNVARTEAQAGGVATFAALLLAALGGCWWPIEIAPGWMQDLALVLPTGWTMDAMHRLVSFGRGASSVATHAGLLVAGTLAAGWGAARTFRYV